MTPERLFAIGAPAGVRATCTAVDFDPYRPAVQAATDFANSGEPLLVLAGVPQVGKSVAAAVGMASAVSQSRGGVALIPCNPDTPGAFEHERTKGWYFRKEYRIGGEPCAGAWVRSSELFDQIFSAAFWLRVGRVPFLVLDDLGLEPNDPKVRDRTVGLLVERYEARRPTIVTCNLSADDFRARYCQGAGARLAARVDGKAWRQVGATPDRRQGVDRRSVTERLKSRELETREREVGEEG